MRKNHDIKEIASVILTKGTLKQNIYNNTFTALKLFKEVAQNVIQELQEEMSDSIALHYKDKSDFEFEIKFTGDVLIFLMHTNVFEFSRYHEVMRTKYIKDDKERSYCGIINIYNFLADSFKYNRTNDLGYLIGRIFINKENHYFIEGKREVASLFNRFSDAVVKKEALSDIILSSILYSINFDLLSPPYDKMKEITVQEMLSAIDNMKITTGKRLGFKFQADQSKVK